jgi:3D (Asp-Asp-Asp) domain-containing protein
VSLSRIALAGALLLLTAIPSANRVQADSACRDMRLTGYVRTEFSARTFDGTSIYTDEPIVAASWDIPLGAYVSIDGLGVYRVADRGRLGSSGWIDVAVWTRSEAYALTGWRQVCVLDPLPPEGTA